MVDQGEPGLAGANDLAAQAQCEDGYAEIFRQEDVRKVSEDLTPIFLTQRLSKHSPANGATRKPGNVPVLVGSWRDGGSPRAILVESR